MSKSKAAASPVSEDPPSLFHLAVVAYVNSRLCDAKTLRARWIKGSMQNTVTMDDLVGLPYYWNKMIRDECFSNDNKITMCAVGHWFIRDNFTHHYGAHVVGPFLNVYPKLTYGYPVCRVHRLDLGLPPSHYEGWQT